MMIAVEVLLIALLIVLGYVAGCFYLNEIKWKAADWRVCGLDKSRIVYLIFSGATGIYLLYILHGLYQTEVVEQLLMICLIFTLLPVAVVDSQVKKIPNQFLLVALAVRIVLYVPDFLLDLQKALFGIKEDILAAAIMGGFFFALFLIFKNSIGMGDVKLFALMGLYQGLESVINSIFFSLFASFLVAIVLLITKKKKRTDAIPFGPCIFLGTMIALRLTGV